ncbi:RagB/SusD family nutrient uptake outer membrane protein [Mucilaginibacter sp. L196]|uniref:RagB/SusD family nutrient uptake outer membrane protein n=1 Tax=Mucilaginibacter sp. L196 TaxID=1641870 RepID=UPI00131C240F|nr:RagB/SusD family nutrient uptake outer membrane protein [Mucilaginibacter sp. L196]
MKIFSFNKNKILVGLLLLALSALVSCKKLIEIPPNPPTQITRAQQFADSASTLSAVVGVYTYNQGQGFAYSDANLTISTGLSADEISSTESYGDESEFYSYTLTPQNSEITFLWQYPYQSLYQVNDVLDGITNNKNLSASFIKQITGEMKVTRALYYFNLVNLFGGVPLVTSTDYAVNAQLPKASVDAVYTQILADLSDAVKKLPASYPVESSGHVRPNLYTALALLSKVHLYQGQWQAAYNEADSIIKSGMYSVTNTPLNGVFLDGSNEAIWQLPAISSDNQTAEARIFVPNSGSTPNFLVTPFLLSQFEAGDQRLQNWIGTAVINNQNLYYPFKYKNVLASATPVEDYMVFRLGEMYLIRAEAAAELNNLSGALADVNIIRARAGLAASTADVTSPTAVLAAVMHERQTELCFEWGNRWFDLKRTKAAGTVLTAEKTGWQSYDALYPLPQAQIQLNSHLIQNPDYH